VAVPVIVRRWAIVLLKLAGFTLIVTAAVVVVSGLFRATMPSPSLRINFEMVFQYALIIGGMAWLAMPHLGEWTDEWPWPLRWATLLIALFLLGTAGTAVGSIAIHHTVTEIQW